MMDEDNYRNNGRAGDDPQAAFEQLRGEVALVRLAVEGLARARESIEIPDYQPTLANTEKILMALTQRVDVIAKSPAMKLTPETMGRSDAHTSEIQSHMRKSYAVLCLRK